MITRVGLAPRARGLSYEACHAHWRGVHAGEALGIPGLRAYTQNHPVLRNGRPLLPYPGFDVCAETQFDDVAAMDAAFASEHYRSSVTSDEGRLIDGSRFRVAVCERRVLAGAEPPDAAVKLMTFLTARDGREALAELLGGDYAEAAADAAPLRHEQLVASDAAHGAGRTPAAYDAVDVLWFATAEDALDAVIGPLSERAGWVLAGHTVGTERLIARPHRLR